jgi:hypothetical protein
LHCFIPNAKEGKNSPEEKSIQEFDKKLFDTLISGEVRSRYDISKREAAVKGMGLWLKLRLKYQNAPSCVGSLFTTHAWPNLSISHAINKSFLVVTKLTLDSKKTFGFSLEMASQI